MTTVKITRIVLNWDMRQRHKIRTGRAARSLKKGEVLVAFNRAQTMARIIDCVGAVHDYYCSDGRFDVNGLRKMVKDGIFLELRVGQSEKSAMSRLELAA